MSTNPRIPSPTTVPDPDTINDWLRIATAYQPVVRNLP